MIDPLSANPIPIGTTAGIGHVGRRLSVGEHSNGSYGGTMNS
jgi:hypothetical protein